MGSNKLCSELFGLLKNCVSFICLKQFPQTYCEVIFFKNVIAHKILFSNYINARFGMNILLSTRYVNVLVISK